MKKYILFLSAATMFIFTGCNMIPKYSQPEAPVPNDWPQGPAYEKEDVSLNATSAASLKWPEYYTDEKLQKVIELALENNRDLQLATLNVERARDLYGIQRAELFPTVDAVGSGLKQRTAADLTSPASPRTTKQFSADLGITAWEIDFFGRIRSLEKQALQEYFATVQVRRSAQIALISELARVYLTLAADLQNLKLAQSTLKTQRDVYNLIKQQFDAQIVNELDLRRVQTQVDDAKLNVARFTQLTAQGINALNLLAGYTVPDDLLPSDLESVNQPADISANLPSEVLLFRPDILAAEHQLKAAYAFIGAARAAFFPRVSLTTAFGTASDEFSNLFNSRNGNWVFAPQATAPIFDLRTQAAYRLSKSVRDIAVKQYEQTIQTAFREVADSLALRGTIDQQILAQQSIVNSAQKIYSLSQKRYKKGIDSYLSVLDAQRTLFSAQQRLIALKLIKLANQARFYAVLGGGGDIIQLPQKDNNSN